MASSDTFSFPSPLELKPILAAVASCRLGAHSITTAHLLESLSLGPHCYFIMTCVPPQIYVWRAGLASCAYWTGISVVPEDWLSSAGTGVQPTDSEQRHHIHHPIVLVWPQRLRTKAFALWKVHLETLYFISCGINYNKLQWFQKVFILLLFPSALRCWNHINVFSIGKRKLHWLTRIFDKCKLFWLFNTYSFAFSDWIWLKGRSWAII